MVSAGMLLSTILAIGVGMLSCSANAISQDVMYQIYCRKFWILRITCNVDYEMAAQKRVVIG